MLPEESKLEMLRKRFEDRPGLSNTTQHPHPLPGTHCFIYCTLTQGRKGGELERRLERQ
jgi:hypothetical protein